MTHILVDTANTFFRARHVIRGDTSEKIGMAIHITMNSIKKAWQDFGGTHMVFCLEGRSWRKDHYAPYKRNRKETIEAMTEKEKEENDVFWECYDDFVNFLKTKTNVTVLQNNRVEADDLIARWIDKHPNEKHVILSTDKDLNQLVKENVKQYNGITEQTITHEGWFDAKNNPVIDKKTNEPKKAVDPEWVLFEKCVRGDSSDNIFSAYPGARLKDTKNKTGITEAYNDRHTGGYNYNNFMLQRWVDHEEQEHRVKDDFERNKILIDLTQQPDEIKAECKQRIAEAKQQDTKQQVGIYFMKFCAKYNLERMSQHPNDYAEFMNGKC